MSGEHDGSAEYIEAFFAVIEQTVDLPSNTEEIIAQLCCESVVDEQANQRPNPYRSLQEIVHREKIAASRTEQKGDAWDACIQYIQYLQPDIISWDSDASKKIRTCGIEAQRVAYALRGLEYGSSDASAHSPSAYLRSRKRIEAVQESADALSKDSDASEQVAIASRFISSIPELQTFAHQMIQLTWYVMDIPRDQWKQLHFNNAFLTETTKKLTWKSVLSDVDMQGIWEQVAALDRHPSSTVQTPISPQLTIPEMERLLANGQRDISLSDEDITLYNEFEATTPFVHTYPDEIILQRKYLNALIDRLRVRNPKEAENLQYNLHKTAALYENLTGLKPDGGHMFDVFHAARRVAYFVSDHDAGALMPAVSENAAANGPIDNWYAYDRQARQYVYRDDSRRQKLDACLGLITNGYEELGLATSVACITLYEIDKYFEQLQPKLHDKIFAEIVAATVWDDDTTLS